MALRWRPRGLIFLPIHSQPFRILEDCQHRGHRCRVSIIESKTSFEKSNLTSLMLVKPVKPFGISSRRKKHDYSLWMAQAPFKNCFIHEFWYDPPVWRVHIHIFTMPFLNQCVVFDCEKPFSLHGVWIGGCNVQVKPSEFFDQVGPYRRWREPLNVASFGWHWIKESHSKHLKEYWNGDPLLGWARRAPEFMEAIR